MEPTENWFGSYLVVRMAKSRAVGVETQHQVLEFLVANWGCMQQEDIYHHRSPFSMLSGLYSCATCNAAFPKAVGYFMIM